ncbi:MAG TPA: ABC transporter permease [Anaerolineae bacterium]|nr:ABC transporter permease [Anaerolineae bacterium]HCC79090.1 ABC transporter permease [Anaerolineae bacterium]HCM97422.1 ABC transporter permease [Anaerolineae bacterium]
METNVTKTNIPAISEVEKPPLLLSQLVFLRFKRHKMAVAGVFILILMICYAIGGTFFKTEAFSLVTDTSIRLNAPSSVHLFGTDAVGRDILARTIYGGQISLLIGLIAMILEVIVGVLIGAIAGYYGGILDSILMRFTEAMLNIPQIPLLLVLGKMLSDKISPISLFGRQFSGSVIVIIAVIGLTSWMGLARIVRANFLSLREQEFVTAARCTGTKNRSIIFEHILPNTMAPIIVSATLAVANAIISEAYVSFLGVGVMPPTATWGNMLNGAYNYIESAPWLWIFPGSLIVLTVLSINFIGDGLRDALDPRALTQAE